MINIVCKIVFDFILIFSIYPITGKYVGGIGFYGFQHTAIEILTPITAEPTRIFDAFVFIRIHMYIFFKI